MNKLLVAMSAAMLATIGVSAAPADAHPRGAVNDAQWHRSRGALPIAADWMLAVKMDDRHIMWVSGLYPNPADARRAFIYDVQTQHFREVAPVPFAKASTDVADGTPLTTLAAIGALADGSVVIAGGDVSNDPKRTAENRLSYRYLPWSNIWVRTGDLPEAQSFVGVPTVLLRDGRLLAAGGEGPNLLANGAGGRHAFVYDSQGWARVAEIDPATGARTGRRLWVHGRWDYTRTADGRVSNPSEPHVFGNLVRLADGRALAVGGHTVWDLYNTGASVLSSHTDFFDPATGAWKQGPPLPTVPGEDNQLTNSHGGRTNGVCVAAMPNDKVVIAGGVTGNDGAPYDLDNSVARQSILVMSPSVDPLDSSFALSPNSVPSGKMFGGLLGEPGRNQLPCWVLSGDRLLIGGGQDEIGEDLYDTYFFNPNTFDIERGPDLLHGKTVWATQHPEWGYPADYKAALIGTREVNMRSSQLVFGGDIVVHGGAYNGLDYDQLGVPYVEQLDLRGHARGLTDRLSVSTRDPLSPTRRNSCDGAAGLRSLGPRQFSGCSPSQH